MAYNDQKGKSARGKQCPVCKSFFKKRVRRKFWMRLIPSSKSYVCGDCSCEYIFITGRVSYKIARPAFEEGPLRMIENQR